MGSRKSTKKLILTVEANMAVTMKHKACKIKAPVRRGIFSKVVNHQIRKFFATRHRDRMAAQRSPCIYVLSGYFLVVKNGCTKKPHHGDEVKFYSYDFDFRESLLGAFIPILRIIISISFLLVSAPSLPDHFVPCLVIHITIVIPISCRYAFLSTCLISDDPALASALP
jgi:hypothetical protein